MSGRAERPPVAWDAVLEPLRGRPGVPSTRPAWSVGVALLLALCAVGFLIAYPFASLFAQAVGMGAGVWVAALRSTPVQHAFGNTLTVAALACLLATAVGTAVALLLEEGIVPGRRLLAVAILLPILIPPFIGAFGWVQAYGPAGLVDTLLGWQLPGLYGPVGVTLLLASHGVPLSYLTCAAALRARGAADLERAARVSGASRWTTMRTVTLPLLRPALAGGAALVFLSAASDFGIPAVVGIPGSFQTVTTEIYRQLAFATSQASFGTAIVLASVLALLALLALAAITRAGFGVAVEPSRGSETVELASPSWRGNLAGSIAWLYVAFVSGIPLVSLVLVALTRAYGLPEVPSNWTLAHFQAALDSQRSPALLNSFILAFGAASIAVVLGALVAALPQRRTSAGLGILTALPYAVPGSTVAVAAILAFTRWWYGSLTIILVTYLARFWALSERPIRSNLSQVGQDALRAARSSGAGPLVAAWTAVVPPLRPTLGAVWALIFLSAFHELTLSSLLYGPRSETVAVIILDLEQGGDVETTAALAVLLTLLVLAVALPLLFSRRAARLAGLGS